MTKLLILLKLQSEQIDNIHKDTDFVVWKLSIPGKPAYLGEGCICFPVYK